MGQSRSTTRAAGKSKSHCRATILTIAALMVSGGSVQMSRADEPSGLVNVNPDPNGEPWIAGGVTKEGWAKAVEEIPELSLPPRSALGKAAATTLPSNLR